MTGLVILLASGLVGQAWAWNCFTDEDCDDGESCLYAAGTTQTYHVNTWDFSSTEEDDIDLGTAAWTARSGEIVRGAEWEFVRGYDVISDGYLGDGLNVVAMRSQTWFTGIGMADYLAVSRKVLDGCELDEVDVSYRDNVSWTTGAPSQVSSGVSIGQVTVHEFGHNLGFAHENDYLASMNSDYPNGGDFAARTYRIGEDDYVALENLKPHSSTGVNLMLSKIEADEYDAGDSYELWANDTVEATNTWSAYAGDTVTYSSGPSAIQAVITGTSSGEWVTISWFLSANGTCTSGTIENLASRTLYMQVNQPNTVVPFSGYSVPSGASSGSYTLCAEIDSNGAVTETSETDNIVKSEKTFEVL